MSDSTRKFHSRPTDTVWRNKVSLKSIFEYSYINCRYFVNLFMWHYRTFFSITWIGSNWRPVFQIAFSSHVDEVVLAVIVTYLVVKTKRRRRFMQFWWLIFEAILKWRERKARSEIISQKAKDQNTRVNRNIIIQILVRVSQIDRFKSEVGKTLSFSSVWNYISTRSFELFPSIFFYITINNQSFVYNEPLWFGGINRLP